MAVFLAGPQPQVQDGSVPHWTSTASSGWQCSPPDLNREFRLAVRASAGSVPRWTSTVCQKKCQKEFQTECQKDAEIMLHYMPESLSD